MTIYSSSLGLGYFWFVFRPDFLQVVHSSFCLDVVLPGLKLLLVSPPSECVDSSSSNRLSNITSGGGVFNIVIEGGFASMASNKLLLLLFAVVVVVPSVSLGSLMAASCPSWESIITAAAAVGAAAAAVGAAVAVGAAAAAVGAAAAVVELAIVRSMGESYVNEVAGVPEVPAVEVCFVCSSSLCFM